MFVTNSDPGTLSIAQLETQICELAVDINAATCAWLRLLAEFERRGGHERAGFHSATAWLAWHCSLTDRAARDQMRVARALEGLPKIEAAFAGGELSYSKVRALSRVATPEFEDELLEIARHGTAAQLERVVSGVRRALATGEELALERRHLHLGWEPDGMLRISGVLPAEEGELLIKAIEAAREALRRGGSEEVRPDRADGLAVLAETLLAQGPAAVPGGERNQVVVHVDLDRLSSGGAAGGEGGAAIGAGGVVDAEAARRLACDASVVTMVERAGEPVSVGRKTRAIPPAVNRALRARDRGCRFPGCTHDRYVDAHHIEHWAAGGETSLENLVLLCRRHHRHVHKSQIAIELDDGGGEPRFIRPDGNVVGERPRVRPPRPLPAAAAPGRSVWTGSGQRLDLGHTVGLLAEL